MSSGTQNLITCTSKILKVLADSTITMAQIVELIPVRHENVVRKIEYANISIFDYRFLEAFFPKVGKTWGQRQAKL